MTTYHATVPCPKCGEPVSLSSRCVRRYGSGLAADWVIECAECDCINDFLAAADWTLAGNREAHEEAKQRERDELADQQRQRREDK